MHTDVIATAGRPTRRLRWWFASLFTALCCVATQANAEEPTRGRASVSETSATIPESPRSFEQVLFAQGPAARPEQLPLDSSDVPPFPRNGRDRVAITTDAGTPIPPPEAPLYLDAEPWPRKVGPLGWSRDILPGSLLWQPPMANFLQPRFQIKGTNLTNVYTMETLDTAIGGTMPMARWTAPEPRDLAWQIDLFAVALSRWSERDRPAAQDYRFGFLITGASGDWSWKIGYEHTSCHVGDEQIKLLGDEINRDSHIREEAVLGLAHTFWSQLRVYGVVAYAFSQTLPIDEDRDKGRINFGFEWISPSRYLRVLQPFSALDVEYRGDQNYYANITFQAGIRIQGPTHRGAVRFGLEFYRGNSPFGQYFDVREDWTGIFAAYDY